MVVIKVMAPKMLAVGIGDYNVSINYCQKYGDDNNHNEKGDSGNNNDSCNKSIVSIAEVILNIMAMVTLVVLKLLIAIQLVMVIAT